MKPVPIRFFVVFIAAFALISLVGVMFVGHSPSGWTTPISLRKPDISHHYLYIMTDDDGDSFEYISSTEEERAELVRIDEVPEYRDDFYGLIYIDDMGTVNVIAPFVIQDEHRVRVTAEFVDDLGSQDAVAEGVRIASREARVHLDLPFFAEDELQIDLADSLNDRIVLPGRTRPVLSPPSLLLLYGTVPFTIAWLATFATSRSRNAEASPPSPLAREGGREADG